MDSEERDEYLMTQVADGRHEQLERLVRRHAGALLTFLCRMVGDRHRAEELFQEVCLALWVKRRRYQYPRPFRPWLYAIALNKCRESFRTQPPAALSLDGRSGADPPAAGAGPDEQAMAGETAELIGRAVTRLPQQQRAVVVLRLWQGLAYARIADLVGCSEATVRSHMHHGLAALRQTLLPLLAPVPR
jgi:RNA polymerase sigma-70 factor (ECF subfamily)